MSYPFIKTAAFISITIGGKPYTIPSSHTNFKLLEDAIKTKDWPRVKIVVDITSAVNEFCEGKIIIRDGVLRYNGEAVDTSIVSRIHSMMTEGFDVTPLVNFLNNLMDNPSYRATQELYGFLEHGKLPITDDGYFLAYKKIKEDFTDIYTGSVDNSIGARPSMSRNTVDEDKNRTCSTGLHFCSYDYLTHFGWGDGNRVVVLKINPRDVVAIPADYNNTKGRCCDYEVLEEVEGWEDENSLAKTSVYVGADESEAYDAAMGLAEDSEEVCEDCGCILTSYEDTVCDSCNGEEGNDDDIPIYCDECGTEEVDNADDVCIYCQDDELASDMGAEGLGNVSDILDTAPTYYPKATDNPIVVVEDDEDTDVGPALHPNQGVLNIQEVLNMRCNDCKSLLNADAKECGYCDSADLSVVEA